MTFRRRHRWFRRLALGLAFATFAAPAAARPDESGGGSSVVKAGGWTGLVDTNTGIPLSAGIPQGDEQLAANAVVAAGAIQDPYLTDAFVRQGESLGGPDGGAQLSQSAAISVRPDDQANRFAHSDVASSRPEAASSGSSVDWDGALTLGLGGVVLALALGLGLGLIRRPRLAGF